MKAARKFDLHIWNNYRMKAQRIGEKIDSFKDSSGVIHLKKEVLQDYIAQITDILQDCSIYMDKCKKFLPSALWTYNNKQDTTHPSNVKFMFKDKMTAELIYKYGENFMQEVTKEKKSKVE